ncbi:zeta toxin family protein [Streptomyces cinereoruber]|uniref:zeta toxin family protein n=1 Tax=Streptomyces cinereoruber TaxID=67260 RepID=UPI003629ED3D
MRYAGRPTSYSQRSRTWRFAHSRATTSWSPGSSTRIGTGAGSGAGEGDVDAGAGDHPDVHEGCRTSAPPRRRCRRWQPGAGKTRIADLVQAALDRWGGAVRICSDLCKAAHSRYAELLADDVRTAGEKVRPETRGW